MPTDTFGYTGSSQTWDASGVDQATFTLNGPGGGGEDQDGQAGGNGGYIEATIDVSSYSSVDIYTGGGGDGGSASSASGGWGYINGQDPGSSYTGAGGGLSAVVANGNLLLKAGGGGGAGNFFGAGGDGADYNDSQAAGSPVGGAAGDDAPGSDGSAEAIDSSASNVTITDGGGASSSGSSPGEDGEISVTYSSQSLSVTTNQPSSIGTTSATLEGNLSYSGYDNTADAWFEWRETGASSWNSTTKQQFSSGSSFNETITVSEATDYEYRAQAEDTAAGVSDTGSTVQFSSNFSVSGTVTDSNDNAISGAKVYIVDSSYNLYTSTTDSSGNFSEQIPNDVYHIAAQHDDGSTKYAGESYPFINQ